MPPGRRISLLRLRGHLRRRTISIRRCLRRWQMLAALAKAAEQRSDVWVTSTRRTSLTLHGHSRRRASRTCHGLYASLTVSERCAGHFDAQDLATTPWAIAKAGESDNNQLSLILAIDANVTLPHTVPNVTGSSLLPPLPSAFLTYWMGAFEGSACHVAPFIYCL